jgi:hypothetical protein
MQNNKSGRWRNVKIGATSKDECMNIASVAYSNWSIQNVKIYA